MASLLVILKLAVATLWENKLRSVLTLIGMIFGNGAVIATLSSNEGAKVFIASQLASLGNKLMTVGVEGRKTTDQDLDVINRYADEIEFAVRERSIGMGQIRTQTKASSAAILAVENSYFSAMNLTFSSGRMMTTEELRSSIPIVYLGHNVRVQLFGDHSFMNEFVSVVVNAEPIVLQVVGSFREKGGTAGAELDGSIFISPGLGTKLLQESGEKLYVILKDDNRSKFAKNQLQALLSPKFGSAIQITDAREAIERTKEIWDKQNLVGICLAGICLLTGGIGIMNIMLLSIHQRQKEIGLRKAVGAKDSEIAAQFLLETVIICLIGGVLGVGMGWLMGQQVATMLGDWKATMTLNSVAITLGFSVLTGVFFGAVPAMRASRIDPYDALRTG